MTPNRRPPKADLVAAMREHPNARASELAELFRVSTTSICNWLRHYDMSTRILTKSHLEQILNRLPDATQAELAALTGYAEVTIRQKMREWRLKTSRRAHQDPERIRALFDEGHNTPYYLSKALGVDWRTAKRWMAKLELGEAFADHAGIRKRYPPCVACTDPVDPDDPVWGGVDNLHYTCARWMAFQRVVAPDDIDSIAPGDAVTWLTTKKVERRGVVKFVQDDIAHIRHGNKAYRAKVSCLSKIVL